MITRLIHYLHLCDNRLLLPISTNLSLPLDITLVISLSKEKCDTCLLLFLVIRLVSLFYIAYIGGLHSPPSPHPNPKTKTHSTLPSTPSFHSLAPQVFIFTFIFISHTYILISPMFPRIAPPSSPPSSSPTHLLAVSSCHVDLSCVCHHVMSLCLCHTVIYLCHCVILSITI